jgi:morphogenetic protein associated with SpoVID
VKIHIVKSGDTLFWLAQKYGVSVEEILKLNPSISNPDVIEVGMKVKIPSNPHGGANGWNDAHTGDGIMHQHVVKQGDTLWKLSKAWGVPLNDLIKANPQLKNPNVLLTGDIVNIPKTNMHAESIVNQMMAQDSGMHNSGNSGNFSPSSIKNSVQGLAGKIPTGIIPGKKNTGKVPTAPIAKTPTGPIAEALPEAPVTLPAPAPSPPPAPIVVEKQVPKPYPVHVEYHQQNVHLFQQCGIPAVEAGAVYGVPQMPEQISPISKGYGYGEPMVSPANIGPEHYGYGTPFVSPVNMGPEHYGYGAPMVSPANVGPEHYGYGAPMVSPANVGPEHYGYGAPLVSPAIVVPEHYVFVARMF